MMGLTCSAAVAKHTIAKYSFLCALKYHILWILARNGCI
jgi:hypothetical protein